jgi:hypothetical protein
LTDEETKARICRALERAKQEIVSLEEHDARAGLGLVFGGGVLRTPSALLRRRGRRRTKQTGKERGIYYGRRNDGS